MSSITLEEGSFSSVFFFYQLHGAKNYYWKAACFLYTKSLCGRSVCVWVCVSVCVHAGTLSKSECFFSTNRGPCCQRALWGHALFFLVDVLVESNVSFVLAFRQGNRPCRSHFLSCSISVLGLLILVPSLGRSKVTWSIWNPLHRSFPLLSDLFFLKL